MADNNREDVTYVQIENIAFSSGVIIYTEGLVTLYRCTIHYGIQFFIYKSQNEPDFTYKMAEMIPSAISNKMIKIISTSVNYHLMFYLLSGIRTVNIISSDFFENWGMLWFIAGNKYVETACSHHLIVFNISIINTTLTNCHTDYLAYGRDSIISM